MKVYFFLLINIVIFDMCFSQDFNKKSNETAQQFIERIIPDSLEINHKIIETKVWDSIGNSIIAFFSNKPGHGDSTEIYGHLYMQKDSTNYSKIEFGPFTGEGETPEILSVFFSNADKDKEKELLVLSKYTIVHYESTGDFYQTDIYDNPNIKYYSLDNFSKLSQEFLGCDCFSRDGRAWKAEYKTAKSVKDKLRAMGF